MNILQTLRQIKYTFQNLTWTNSPSSAIFSHVVISDVPARDLIGKLRHPFAVIHSPNATSENENPLKQSLSIDIEIYSENQNDEYGEAVLLGATNVITTGTSAGKGIFQLEYEIKSSMDILAAHNGIRYWSLLGSGRGQGVVQNNLAMAIRVLSFKLGIYDLESYVSASTLAAAQVANAVVLTWVDPPARFDLLNIHIRRKANSAPISIADGTALGNVNKAVLTYTDTAPGAGTWYYAIYGGYDSSYRNPLTTATHWSTGISKSIVVV